MAEIVIIIRPSFKKICGPNACRAALYNHLLFRLAGKAKKEPDKKVRDGEVFWYASAKEICQDMDEAWSVNTVRKEINELVKSGLVGQRHNPEKGWDREYQYFVGKEQGEKLREHAKTEGVCLLHMGLSSEVLHLLHLVNAFTKSGACICQKEEMDLPNMVNPFTIFGEAIPKESLREQTEESTKETKDAPLSEPSMSGKWDAEKVVQYAEYRNGRRYSPKMRDAQLKAARKLHTDDASLTLDLFKLAYDKRFDQWWIDNQKALHVTHMAAKDGSGAIRLYAMLDKIEADKRKPNLKLVSSTKKPQDDGLIEATNRYHAEMAERERILAEERKARA